MKLLTNANEVIGERKVLMKKNRFLILSLLITVLLTGCNTTTSQEVVKQEKSTAQEQDVSEHNSEEGTTTEELPATESTVEESTESKETAVEENTTEEESTEINKLVEEEFEEIIVPSTEETVVIEEPVVEMVEEEPIEELNEAQKNSIAMLNYLATLSQEINASSNSRMFLEEAYASLINNTNPEKVNELTESHLSSLLDIIEQYRIINVKREHLQYLYDQNKAIAIKSAVPNPIGVLSAAESIDLKRLAASTIYMAMDSYSSYETYNNDLDNEFLQDGWILDEEETDNLHDSRKRAFLFMIEIVREENLPGELALSESAVETFVTWKNNDNVNQRLQFLESEEKTYEMFGNYWLELAECYYEKEDYEKCLDAISKYEERQSDIFRKDYYFAQIMPKAIVAASKVYSEEEYILVAEKYLDILLNNTEATEWSLRYFAAETYLDLYAKTNNSQYITKAYNIALNNVNYLIKEQEELNNTYLTELEDVKIPENATKEEKKQINEYNKSLKKKRENELPTVYEPLVLNCDLLFALAEERDISVAEKNKIEGILEGAFLLETYQRRYSFEDTLELSEVIFDKAEIIMPASLLEENATVVVTVIEDGTETKYEDWQVKKVDREGESVDTFSVTLRSEKIKKQKWSKNTIVRLEIIDGEAYDSTVMDFKIENYKEGLLMLPDKFEFKQVK